MEAFDELSPEGQLERIGVLAQDALAAYDLPEDARVSLIGDDSVSELVAAKVIPAFTVKSAFLTSTTSDSAASARWIPKRIPLHHDDLGVVQQTVHRGAGEQLISEERGPLVDVAVGRDDHGAALVALADDLVEVERLIVHEGS